MSRRARKPTAFKPDASTVVIDVPEEERRVSQADVAEPPREGVPAPVRPSWLPAAHRGLRWGAIFAAAISILVSAAIALAVADLIEGLYARYEWLGHAAMALLGLAVFAALAICLKEIVALFRLRRLERLRIAAERALRHGGANDARDAMRGLKRLYRDRKDMAWSLSRLAEHDGDVIDASGRVKLAERTLMADLDTAARGVITVYVKRVSLVTAVNPAAILDIVFVAAQNLSMIRRLATLYGTRPGTVGTLKLARMVLGHLIVSGGLALGDNLVQHVLGRGLAGRLSARIGEGAINGIMTARIGNAALDLCRPLPFTVLHKPGLKSLLAGTMFSEDQKAE